MKNSVIVELFGLALLALFVFGVLLPFLISAKSTVAVVGGILIIAGIGLAVALYINKMVKEKSQQKEVEVVAEKKNKKK